MLQIETKGTILTVMITKHITWHEIDKNIDGGGLVKIFLDYNITRILQEIVPKCINYPLANSFFFPLKSKT